MSLSKKISVKLAPIKANKHNHASRLVYITSIFVFIPIYYMANILFSQRNSYAPFGTTLAPDSSLDSLMK
jgi:hypothetical protein